MSKTFQVTVTDEQYEWLREHAEEDMISMSAVVRQALKKIRKLEERERKK